MNVRPLSVLTVVLLALACANAHSAPDPEQDILVTFRNDGAHSLSGGIRAPYRARKRYLISADAQRDANAIAKEFALEQVDHWPIRSLGVYCFVYRVPGDADRDVIISRLREDQRVESVQALQSFETGTNPFVAYNDTYAAYQYGLDVLGIENAHKISRGAGIHIAIIDSNVDLRHEDLKGRIRSVRDFTPTDRQSESEHGTAVLSVIGANANNAAGIVGIAPEAKLDLLVACWHAQSRAGAVCDTFSLAKALDTLVDESPEVLNMSISGPDDALLARLIRVLVQQGVAVVAADTAGPGQQTGFPANQPGVISVGNAQLFVDAASVPEHSVFAPGERIMVAIPRDEYDFRSGSSLSAAQISGVVALLLSNSPRQTPTEVLQLLHASQGLSGSGLVSVDACRALTLASGMPVCRPEPYLANSEPDSPGH